MTTELTKRDIKLLYGLGLFLLVVGFVFLMLIPALDEKSLLEEQRTDVQNHQFEMEQQINLLPINQRISEENTQELARLREDLYPVMNTSEIDKLITQMVQEYGLEAQDFAVSEVPELKEFTAYPYSDLALQQQIEATAASTTDGSAASSNAMSEASIYTSTISVKAVGNQTAIWNMVNTLFADHPALRLVSYTMDTETIRVGDTQVYADVSTLSMNIEMYMYTE